MTGLLFDDSQCAVCGQSLPEPSSTGRPRTTCGDACRKRASRLGHETRSAPEAHSDPSFAAVASAAPDSGHRDAPRSLADIASAIPTPVDSHFGPCRAYLSLVDPGGTGRATWRVAWGIDGGRAMQPVGPVLDRRGASTLADLLNSRLVPVIPEREGRSEGALGSDRPSRAGRAGKRRPAAEMSLGGRTETAGASA